MNKLYIFGIAVLVALLIPSFASATTCANITLTETKGVSEFNIMNIEPYMLVGLNGTNISQELRIYDDGNGIGNILPRDIVWYNSTAARFVTIWNFTLAGGASKNVSACWDNGLSDPGYNRIRLCYDNFSVADNTSGTCGWKNEAGTQGWANGAVWLYAASGATRMNASIINMTLPGEYAICGTYNRLSGTGLQNDITLLSTLTGTRHMIGGAGATEPYYCGGVGCTDLGSVTYNQSGERMCLHMNGTAAGNGKAVWMPDTNGTRSQFIFDPDDTPVYGWAQIEGNAVNVSWDNITIYNESDFNEYNNELAYLFYAPAEAPSGSLPQPIYVSPTQNNATTLTTKYAEINLTDLTTLTGCKLEWCNTSCTNLTVTPSGKYCYANISQTANVTGTNWVIARGFLTNSSGENVSQDRYFKFEIQVIPSTNLCANISITEKKGIAETNAVNIEPMRICGMNGTNISQELRIYADGNCLGSAIRRDVTWYNDTCADVVFIVSSIGAGATINYSINWNNGLSDPGYNRIRWSYDNFTSAANATLTGNGGWQAIGANSQMSVQNDRLLTYSSSGNFNANATTFSGITFPTSICGWFTRVNGTNINSGIGLSWINDSWYHQVGTGGSSTIGYYCDGVDCPASVSYTHNLTGERVCLHINGTSSNQARMVFMADTNGTRTTSVFTPTSRTTGVPFIVDQQAIRVDWDNFTIYNESEINEYNTEMSYLFFSGATSSGPEPGTLPQPTWVTPSSNATSVNIKYQLMNWTDLNTVSSGKLEWCNTSCVNYTATCSGKYCYLNMSQTANLTYVVARGYLDNGTENVTKDIFINFSNLQTPAAAGNCTNIANIEHPMSGQISVITLLTGDWSLSEIWDCIEDNTSLQQISLGNWFLNANITVNSAATLWINDTDTNWLKINSTGTATTTHDINGTGRLMINNTKITSWNSITNSFDTGSVFGSDARSYIYMNSYGGMHYIENSNVSYLGWSQDDSGYYHSQGLEFDYTQIWYDNNSGTGMRTGITLFRGYNSTIKNSKQTYAGDDDGFFVYISNTTLVHNNNCTGNHIMACIQVADGKNITITDNYASDTQYGFWLIGNYWDGGYYYLVANNTAVGNTYGFADEYGGYYHTFRNNTAYNNNYGYWTAISPSNTSCSPCTQTGYIFENNTFRNNTVSNVKISVAFTNTIWNWNSIYGPGSGYNFDNSQTNTVNATYNDWWLYTNASIEAELHQNSGTIYYYPFLAQSTPDTTPPNIDWISPANQSFTANVSQINWDVTVSETPNQCYLQINSTANISMNYGSGHCIYNSTSLTNTTTYCGKVYANDSSGNMNLSSVQCTTINLSQYSPPAPYCGDGSCNGGETCGTCSFDCGVCEGGGGDTTPPTVTISSPTNTTYNTSLIWLNATSNENGSMWYKLNGGSVVSLDIATSGLCYQENATSSTACGGLNTGVYSFYGSWINVGALFDGNWETSGQASGISEFLINYTKPSDSLGANVTYKVAMTTYNLTIPSECWGAFATKISLRAIVNSEGLASQLYCNNGITWVDVYVPAYCSGTYCVNISEEGIWWKMSSSYLIHNTTITTNIGSNTMTVYANDSSGNIGSMSVSFYVDANLLTNCSASSESTTETMHFYLKDEDSFALLNGTLNITFNVTDGGGIWKNYSYAFNGSNNYSVCINPSYSSYYADAFAQYSSTGYSDRTYFLDYATISNITKNISLYLSSNATTTLISFTVIDASSTPIGDVAINIQRFYPGTGTYETIDVLKTDPEGKASGYLTLYTTWYKFILTKNGEVIWSENPRTLSTTSVTFTITSSSFREFQYYGSIAHNCSINTATNTTTCTILDSSGNMISSNLLVARQTGGNWVTVCNNTVSGSSSTIPCYMGDINGSKFWYGLTGQMPQADVLIESGYLDFRLPSGVNYGDLGILSAFFIVLVLAFVGAFRPNIAMVLVGISFFVCVATNLIIIAEGSIIAFFIVIGIIIYNSKRSG